MPKRLSPTACYAILAVVLLVGLAIRLQYLLMAIRTPGFTWSDPDGYLEHALMLAGPHRPDEERIPILWPAGASLVSNSKRLMS